MQTADRIEQISRIDPFVKGSAQQLIELAESQKPEIESGGLVWWHRGMAVYTAVIQALCHKRDHAGFVLSAEVVLAHFASLEKIEDLYMEAIGAAKALDGQWPTAFEQVRHYLEVICPGYSVPQLLINKGFLKGEVRPQDPTADEHHCYYVLMVWHALNRAVITSQVAASELTE